MNDDTIADLKQFIATTVRQEVASLEDRLGAKIDALQASVAEALDTTNDDAHERLQNHVLSLIRLD
jgi:energy-coupling factor transporter ATP-binding protein EcfA2